MNVFDMVAHFRIYTLVSCPPSQKELPWRCFHSCYAGLQNCPSLLDTARLRNRTRNVRNSLNFLCYMKNCPSTRCVKAANLFRRGADMFRKPITALRQILCKQSIFGHKSHFLVAMQFDNKFSPSVQSAPKLTSFCPFLSPSSSLWIHRAIILLLFSFCVAPTEKLECTGTWFCK